MTNEEIRAQAVSLLQRAKLQLWDGEGRREKGKNKYICDALVDASRYYGPVIRTFCGYVRTCVTLSISGHYSYSMLLEVQCPGHGYTSEFIQSLRLYHIDVLCDQITAGDYDGVLVEGWEVAEDYHG